MTDNQDATCQLALTDAIKVGSDLDEFVVAFDRIFSRIAFGEGGPDLLVTYMMERAVRERIAAARSVVFAAVERVIGEDAVERIAEEKYRHFE
ncbi:hypothetical protein AB0G04_43690 [Actinoplanes sp. NPDC023801]|uniref:hypothetical protein n=1 Tax=Actinoplanes sp. NPDC023801 TaxID=3154595 RepID=UPI00340A8336